MNPENKPCNFERGGAKALMKSRGIHSFGKTEFCEKGVKIGTTYFSNSTTSFCNMGRDRLIISHKISGVILS